MWTEYKDGAVTPILSISFENVAVGTSWQLCLSLVDLSKTSNKPTKSTMRSIKSEQKIHCDEREYTMYVSQKHGIGLFSYMGVTCLYNTSSRLQTLY